MFLHGVLESQHIYWEYKKNMPIVEKNIVTYYVVILSEKVMRIKIQEYQTQTAKITKRNQIFFQKV